MERSDDMAVLTVNDKQKRVLLFLEKLHLLRITGSDRLMHPLRTLPLCEFAYIRGWRPLTRWIARLSMNGFMVSEDGPDRRKFDMTIDILTNPTGEDRS